jgi:hypothetical protein
LRTLFNGKNEIIHWNLYSLCPPSLSIPVPQVLRDYFMKLDPDQQGRLDQIQLQQLLRNVPNLSPDDKKFIMAYYAKADVSHTGKLSFDDAVALASWYQTVPGAPRVR